MYIFGCFFSIHVLVSSMMHMGQGKHYKKMFLRKNLWGSGDAGGVGVVGVWGVGGLE
jgi:hypothetical protein